MTAPRLCAIQAPYSVGKRSRAAISSGTPSLAAVANASMPNVTSSFRDLSSLGARGHGGLLSEGIDTSDLQTGRPARVAGRFTYTAAHLRSEEVRRLVWLY